MQLTELVTKVRWQLLLNRAGYIWPHVNVAFHVERHLELLDRIVLTDTLVLPNTQPASFDKLHPTVIAKAGRNECFHLLRNEFMDLPVTHDAN